MRWCKTLIDNAYHFSSTSPSSDPADNDDETLEDDGVPPYPTFFQNKQPEDVPPELARAIRQLRDTDDDIELVALSRVPAPNGFYSDNRRNGEIGNSYVCFRSAKDKNGRWSAGRIQHICRAGSRLYFAIQRSRSHAGGDFLQGFWNDGFEARVVSDEFHRSFELVLSDKVIAHSARWRIAPGQVAVVNLDKVSKHPRHSNMRLMIYNSNDWMLAYSILKYDIVSCKGCNRNIEKTLHLCDGEKNSWGDSSGGRGGG